ncbi:MAG: RidA family protein [Planctomycetota bacterium]|jgi:2-iminobutanoate/2-iminopropanoate deaminase
MAALAVPVLTACFPLESGTVYMHADAPLGPYSGSVLSGDFCFVSGKIGDANGSFEAEASSAMTALEQELSRAGLTLYQLVQVTVYLTNIDNLEAFNDVYAARVPEPYPARVVVQVDALPGDSRVEIQATARRH